MDASGVQFDVLSSVDGVGSAIKRFPPGLECGENVIGDNEADDVDIAVDTRGGGIVRTGDAVPDLVRSSRRG